MGRTKGEGGRRAMIGTRLEPHIKETVEQIARKERRTVSQVVSMLVEEALVNRKGAGRTPRKPQP